MCTADEVKRIVRDEVASSEKRLESYIDDLFAIKHKKNLNTFSNLMGDIQQRLKSLGDTIEALGITTHNNKAEIKDIHDWKIVKDVKDEQTNANIEKIMSTLSRLMWIVVTGVVVAVLGLILK